MDSGCLWGVLPYFVFSSRNSGTVKKLCHKIVHDCIQLASKLLSILFWAFVVLGKYLGTTIIFRIFETFYECEISLELCEKLIFTKIGIMV